MWKVLKYFLICCPKQKKDDHHIKIETKDEMLLYADL